MNKVAFAMIVSFLNINVYAQPSAILKEISELQCQTDSFYQKGMFPCQITWKKGRNTAEDNNVFFSMLTLYTLQSISDRLNPADQLSAIKILDNAGTIYSPYQNRHGNLTYNFYSVRPEMPFPNVPYLSNRKSSRLPDDLDCTSFAYLVKQQNHDRNVQLKLAMEEQSELHPKIRSTIKPFKKSKVYRTWFADEMKQDIDVCVVSNVLLFMIQNDLTLSEIDKESIAFITYVVRHDLHLSKKHKISTYYPNSPIILYHITRLIAASNNEDLNQLAPDIIADIDQSLVHVTNEMEKVILLSSLYRLGEQQAFYLDSMKLRQDMKEFYWFDAQPIQNIPLLGGVFTKSDFMRLQYRSKAYYLSLLLELQVLSGNHFNWP